MAACFGAKWFLLRFGNPLNLCIQARLFTRRVRYNSAPVVKVKVQLRNSRKGADTRWHQITSFVTARLVSRISTKVIYRMFHQI